MGQLSQLHVLSANNNNLHGVLPPLWDLAELQQLSLGGNRFSGQLPDISQSTKLLILQLNGNSFSGNIRDDYFQHYRRHKVQHGKVETFPSMLSKLQFVLLQNNRLSGVTEGSNSQPTWPVPVTALNLLF